MTQKASIKGRKILLFAPHFFGYELHIRDKMQQMGAEVTFHDERAVTSSYLKALLKIDPRLLAKQSDKYYGNILKTVSGTQFDYVIFIKCEMITYSMLMKYRKVFSNSKFVLYLWDSKSNIKQIEPKLSVFDSLLTFDRQDALRDKRFQFRPLFFIDDFICNEKKEDSHYDYDICFIGTVHADRYKIIKTIEQQCQKHGLKFFTYLFLQNKAMYWFYRLTKAEFRHVPMKRFRFDKAKTSDVSKWVDSSRIVLDIQHPKQTGLTMRSIEMLGMKKKMVTTNGEVMAYNFYRSENICVINRENPVLDKKFMLSGYFDIQKDIYNQYSLESWIRDIVNGVSSGFVGSVEAPL